MLDTKWSLLNSLMCFGEKKDSGMHEIIFVFKYLCYHQKKNASSSKATWDFIAGQALFYLDSSYCVIPDRLFLSTQAQIFISWLLIFGLTSVAILAIAL